MEGKDRILSCAVLLFAATALVSCEKLSSYDYPETATSYGILTDDENFTYYRYIVARAGLVNMLDGNQEFTVFAPTNRSFQQHGYTFDGLRTATVSDLSALVKNHLVPGKID